MPTLRELLLKKAEIDEQVLRYSFMRNRNSPIADIAEQIVARVLGGKVVHNNTKGHDVLLPDGRKVEVKSRMLGAHIGQGELFGVLREPLRFSQVAFVVFHRDYSLRAMRIVDEGQVREYSRYGDRINGWQTNVKRVLDSTVPDYTKQAMKVWGKLGNLTAAETESEPVDLPKVRTGNNIQYKKRMWFQRDWMGKGTLVEFTTTDGITYRYPHDEILAQIIDQTGYIAGTHSWEEEGVYHMSNPSRLYRKILEPYRIGNEPGGSGVKKIVTEVLKVLNVHELRCTYQALAEYSGAGVPFKLFPYLGKKRPEASWVVREDDGLPGKYTSEDIHPNLKKNDRIIETAEQLRALMDHAYTTR